VSINEAVKQMGGLTEAARLIQAKRGGPPPGQCFPPEKWAEPADLIVRHPHGASEEDFKRLYQCDWGNVGEAA
jgi:hypothetical protein